MRTFCASGSLEQARQHLVAVFRQYGEGAVFHADLLDALHCSPGFQDALALGVDRQVQAVHLANDLDQLIVRAAGDHFAVIHDGDVVGELLGFLHIVGGVQDGHALVFQALPRCPGCCAATAGRCPRSARPCRSPAACAAAPRRC